jgi:hypothetical protein
MSEPQNMREVLERLMADLASAVPGPYGVSQSDTPTREAMLAYLDRATQDHESTVLFQIHTEHTSPSGLPLALAITGNGPKAETHARVLAASLTLAPILLDTLYSAVLWAEAAVAAINAGDTESALNSLDRMLKGLGHEVRHD